MPPSRATAEVAAYRYDVYGRPTETSSQGNSGAMPAGWAEAIAERNVLRYASYVYDTRCGLSYPQRRYYDAILRQFLSRDPWRSDGTESPYQYCAGNPVAGTDPWGLYVTASGGRTNTEFYVPQSGRTYRAGNAPDFWRAPPTTGSVLQSPARRWGISLGALPPPASGLGVPTLQRVWNGFWSGSAEWGRWFLGDPEADPLRGSNPVLAEHTYAALTALGLFLPTPAGKARAGTIVARFGDDAVKYAAGVVRVAGAGDEAARAGGAATRGAPKVGDEVWRVFGGDSRLFSRSGRGWSRANPHRVANYRDAAGLPSRRGITGYAGNAFNSGGFVAHGRIRSVEGVKVGCAKPLHGCRRGIDELYFPDQEAQIVIDAIYGMNPPF